MLTPSEGDDRRRGGQLRSASQQISLRLFFRRKVQQNRIGIAVADFSDCLPWRENLPDAVAGFSENFLQNVAEGLVRIYQQDTFDSFP
jgi:hypothetical protein